MFPKGSVFESREMSSLSQPEGFLQAVRAVRESDYVAKHSSVARLLRRAS